MRYHLRMDILQKIEQEDIEDAIWEEFEKDLVEALKKVIEGDDTKEAANVINEYNVLLL